MISYPKHYLAEVPHDLRMRVLDLCIHRQWHDALDLLNQNGFTQYEWYELVWFHDHAPTNLEPVGGIVPDEPSASVESAAPGEPLSVVDSEISNLKCEILPPQVVPASAAPGDLTNSDTLVDRKSQIVNPRTLTPSDPEQRTGNPEPSAAPVKPKRRRPRSKACRLPTDVRLTLNTMLAGGCRSRDIIHTLNTRGYPGFNKANLNAWKRTGFESWLRTQDGADSATDQNPVVTDQAVLETGSNG